MSWSKQECELKSRNRTVNAERTLGQGEKSRREFKGGAKRTRVGHHYKGDTPTTLRGGPFNTMGPGPSESHRD